MGRWGKLGGAYLERAVTAFAEAVQRHRGGAPAKIVLHSRWVAMYDGHDRELEELVADGVISRVRAIADERGADRSAYLRGQERRSGHDLGHLAPMRDW
jgi:hypothetical protein